MRAAARTGRRSRPRARTSARAPSSSAEPLAVLPTDVVNAADRGSVSERAVWPRRVVVVEPVWQGCGAVVVGAVGEPVGPLTRHRLVEAFDLAVGAGPVGLGREVSDLVGGEQLAE